MTVRTKQLKLLNFCLGIILVSLMLFSPINPVQLQADGSTPLAVTNVQVGGGGYNPWGIALNSTSNKIYVANNASNNISVINGSNNNILGTVTVGTNPKGIAVNTDSNRIYVANDSSNNLSVVDGDTNAVVATVPLGVHPVDVTFRPVFNRIYVANYGSNSVSQIYGSTNTVEAEISVGSQPTALALNAQTGRLYVANYASNNVSVIDCVSKAVIATISVGNHPVDIEVNATTNRIYSADSGGSTITVIDGTNNSVLTTINNVAVSLRGLAVDPVANRIYAASDNSDTFTVINSTTNAVTATVNIPVCSHGLMVNASTHQIYVTNYDYNNIYLINGTTNVVSSVIYTGVQPESAAVNTVTNRIYVTNYDSNNVVVIDGSNNNILGTAGVGSHPVAAAVNSTTNRIYVANYSSNTLSVLNGSDNSLIASVNVGSRPRGLAVSQTLNRIYVANYGSNTVSVINGADYTIIATINVGNGPKGLTRNPGPPELIYVTNYSSNTISVINTSSNSVTATINNVGSGTSGAAFNPSNHRLYVTNDLSNNLSVIDSTTNAVVATVNVGNTPEGVAVNPVNNRVYVTNFNSNTISVIDGSSNLVVATLNVGSSPESVAVNQATNRIYLTNRRSDSISVLQDSSASITSLVASANPADFSQPVTLTAQVSAGSGVPSGTINFFDGSTLLGSGTLDTASETNITTSALTAGVHSLSAVYSGDSNFAASTGNLSLRVIHITFPDANLEAVVRQAINKPSGDIYQSDLTNLTSLTAENKNISSLEGLEYCVNLTDINLNANQIGDISPLSGLLKLRNLYINNNYLNNVTVLSSLLNLATLDLGVNQINNISGFSNLPALTSLNLGNNQISNLSTLSNLNLQHLSLENNQISNLAVLSTLTNLVELNLANNRMSKVAVIGSLTNLQSLNLNSNRISDITALSSLIKLNTLLLQNNLINSISSLVSNSGLSSGDYLNLAYNALSVNTSSQNMTDITTLQGRGVSIVYQPQITTTTVTASANPSIYSNAVTFTATVSPIPDGGTVQFSDNGSSLGGLINIDSSGNANYTTSTLTSGAHTISANYSGDISFRPSAGALIQNVKAALLVAAQNQSIVYSQPLPVLTVSYSGFINGDTESVLRGSPSVTTTATPYSALGTYDVVPTAGTLNADNYLFLFLNGTLTISQASTTSILVPSANPSNMGQLLTLTCVVRPVLPATYSPGGQGIPTGTVIFKEGNTTLATLSLNIEAKAVYSSADFTLGDHNLTIEYSGDANFGASTGAVGLTISTSVSEVMHGSDLLSPVMQAAAPYLNTAGLGVTINTAQMVASTSEQGINDLLAGSCDMTMSVRPLTTAEASTLTAHAVARGATIIIVDRNVPTDITQLTLNQIKEIYEGTLTNWNQVGSSTSLPIVIQARNIGSDIRYLLLNQCNINDTAEQTLIMIRIDSDAQMQTAINESVAGAIGYANINFGQDSAHANVREIAVINPADSKPYAATKVNIYSAKYPLTHFLYLVNKSVGDSNQTKLLDWLQGLDGAGQAIIASLKSLILTPDADVLNDGVIDISDIQEIGNYYGQVSPADKRADVLRDGITDISDIQEVGNWYGTEIAPY